MPLGRIKKEVLSGILFWRKRPLISGMAVGIALIPEAITFSFVAGVPPTAGLYGLTFNSFWLI